MLDASTLMILTSSDNLTIDVDGEVKELGTLTTKEAEELMDKVKKAIEKEDLEEIKSSKDKLLEKANQFASKVYEEAAKANQGSANAENTKEESTSKKEDDGVVDADFEEK